MVSENEQRKQTVNLKDYSRISVMGLILLILSEYPTGLVKTIKPAKGKGTIKLLMQKKGYDYV